MSEEEVIRKKLAEFVDEMRPLDGEFAKILHDNLWDLYIQSSGKVEMVPVTDILDEEDLEECLVTLDEWNDMQDCSAFISDDGSAYYSTETEYSHISAFLDEPPQWATHVILFGK